MIAKDVLVIALSAAMLLLGPAQSIWQGQAAGERKAENVNLALRATAHRLLVLAGDPTSVIPPVLRTEDGAYWIELGRTFEYDSLPPVLNRALLRHSIHGEYNIALIECENEANLILGYTASTARPGEEVPCGGRDQTPGCYLLRLTFLEPAPADHRALLGWASLGLLPLLGLLAYRRLRARRDVAETPEDKRVADAPVADAAEPGWQRAGQSALHAANQVLRIGAQRVELTYREAKLLGVFFGHPNALLEREFLLKAVWEDEGIVVGRSLDVFVSRLRKLLRDDPTVKITTVHGVGYRLEVAP